MYKKKNGIYYTPEEISLLVCKYLQKQYLHRMPSSILEPSCGEGSYIDAILKTFETTSQITAVEKNKAVAKKLKLKFLNTPFVKTLCADFLNFSEDHSNKYDLIIGNPPYVRKNNISKSQMDTWKNIATGTDFIQYDLKNLWVAFLLLSIKQLTPHGIISFVLPAEMLQVSYASPLRDLLIRNFDLIEVVKFSNDVFVNLQQNVIVLNCIKKFNRKGLLFTLLETKDLNSPQFSELAYLSSPIFNQKWVNERIGTENQEFVECMTKKLPKVIDLCSVAPGLVTGANDYFIRSQSNLQELKLLKFKLPILQNGEHIHNLLDFTKDDFKKIIDSNARCYLVALSKKLKIDSTLKKFLKMGDERQIPERYKCRQRTHWYVVARMEKGEGYFFKRSHKYPKIVKNSHDVLATDSAYRVNMRNKDHDISSFIFSFYNSLTLIHCELEGRVYGGGVLELTPSEFRKLPVPYFSFSKSLFKKADKLTRTSGDIEQLIMLVDEEVLVKKLGLSSSIVAKLQAIRRGLVLARITRK